MTSTFVVAYQRRMLSSRWSKCLAIRIDCRLTKGPHWCGQSRGAKSQQSANMFKRLRRHPTFQQARAALRSRPNHSS
ncbi:hypothetical protein TNCV_2687791 [Trichonephila clavipes]|nr:hypothetical protein TNCV_2687791 [Trichonephila clavipes]